MTPERLTGAESIISAYISNMPHVALIDIEQEFTP